MDIQKFSDIYERMKRYLIASQDKITDFNHGSAISSIVETVAREIERLYTKCRVGYDFYLKGIPYSIFNFNKKQGLVATCTVKFSRSEVLNSTTIIPAGTKLSSGDLFFITTEQGKIESGAIDSNEIKIRALDVGTKYNVAAKSVNTIESSLPNDIVHVENTTKVSGGTDGEKDGEFLIRFQNYINGLQGTNMYGLKTAITKLDIVRSVLIEEHTQPIDDIYNITIYIDDGSLDGASQETLNKVKKIVCGDGTLEFPGAKAAGINVRILPVDSIHVNIKAKITVQRMDKEMAKSNAAEVIKNYVNSLQIGESLVLSSLCVKLRSIDYIVDAQIIEPIENMKIASNQIIRAKDCFIIADGDKNE